ncbi:hypothetical protein C8R43DRAFT_1136982 [Mycena crocata]|nr:hypothetical protein C8R43DRAFT_1136982 [Mycena crocata]
MAAATSQLWATASKEWVIQRAPKPGRKPRGLEKEQPIDYKRRRVQNRAAQRAFRQRKQSQLADLQDRVRSYEQGEYQRNVALRNIAKSLKEENESLRHENWLLKERGMIPESGQADPIASNSHRKWYNTASSPGSNHFCNTRLSAIQLDAFAFTNLELNREAALPPFFDPSFCNGNPSSVDCNPYSTRTACTDFQFAATPIRTIVIGDPPPPQETFIPHKCPTQINTDLRAHSLSRSAGTPLNYCGGSSISSDAGFGNTFCEKCFSASDEVLDMGESAQGSPFPIPSTAVMVPSFIRIDAASEANPTIIALADSDMPAPDVAARRSRTKVPRRVLPKPALKPSVAPDDRPVLLTDPYANFHEKERARIRSTCCSYA